MHVIWVNDFAFHAGGAEHYITRIAPLFRARGVRCTLLYGVEGWTDPSFTSKSFDAAFPLVAPARQVAELGGDVVFVHQLADHGPLRRLRRGPAPVVRFLHDYHLFCLREHKYTAIGQRTCARTAGLVCYPCLGFLHRTTARRGRTDERRGFRLRTLSELRAQQEANRELDGFVVGSAYMRAHAAAHGFPPERIHHLDMFVELPDAPEAPADLHAARTPDRLLFVGALIIAKGLDLLLRALEEVPDVVLDVVGRGPQRADYERQARRFGVAGRVRFRGQMSPAELAGYYRRAACTVVPSRYPETFGFVGPEALLQGCPVVAARVGGTGEWLRDGETARGFASGDSGALAAAIRRTLADPSGSRAMAERGRRMCRERFRADRHVDRLLALLEREAGRA